MQKGRGVSRNSLGITTLYFGGLWEVEKETGTLAYLHGDHLGSVSIVTDSTGAKVSGEEYGAWGQVRSGDNSATAPVDFTGQHKDGMGLRYYGARYYDPVLGRFLSPDSASDGVNPYRYVRNNPLNRTDPTGYSVLSPIVHHTL